MAPPRKKPAIALSKIPSVKELCDKLGFQRVTSRETSVFTDATHAFRKSYRTSSGASGVDLTEWKDGTVQRELSAMAVKYLDEGHGLRFWSNSRSWMEEGDFQYPEDRTQIADLLKQLFWKQNKYALNNQTYSDKKSFESRDHSRDNITPVGESAQNSSAGYRQSSSQNKPYYVPSSTLPDIQPRGEVISLLEDSSTLTEIQNPFPRNGIFDVPVELHNLQQTPMAEEEHFEDSYTRVDPFEQCPKQSGNKERTSNGPSPKTPKRTREGVTPKRSSDGPTPKRAKIRLSLKSKEKEKNDTPRRLSSRKKVSISYKDATASDIFDDDFPEDIFDEYQNNQQGLMHETEQRNELTHPRMSFERMMDTSPQSLENLTGRSAANDARDLSDSGSAIENAPQRRGNVAPTTPMARDLSTMPSYPSPEPSTESAYSHQVMMDAENPTYTKIPAANVAKALKITVSDPYRSRSPASIASPSTIRPSSEPPFKPKSSLRGDFWIVTSNPTVEEEWCHGTIKNKSLPTLLREISMTIQRDGISKVKIRLKTALAETTTIVNKDAEGHWESTKLNLEDRIREAFRKDRIAGNHYQIWIEPLFESFSSAGGMDGDEVDIDF